MNFLKAVSALFALFFSVIIYGAEASEINSSDTNRKESGSVTEKDPLAISAFKDITYFVLEAGKAKELFNVNVKYVKDADEAHSDLVGKKADLVFMSYDDTLSLVFNDKYSDIMAVMPIHGGILDLCGSIDLSRNKNKIGIDTDSGYARALRYYFHQQYPSQEEYDKLTWLKEGATNIRYIKLINGEIDATLLNPPFSYKPGVTRMVKMYDVIGEYQGVVVNLNKTWLENPINKKRLGDFAAAYYSRVQEMKSNPDKTILELKEFYSLSDSEAADVYSRLWQQDGLSLNPQFNLNKLEGTENLFSNDTSITVTLPRTWIGDIQNEMIPTLNGWGIIILFAGLISIALNLIPKSGRRTGSGHGNSLIFMNKFVRSGPS